jgi:hypothetical protein
MHVGATTSQYLAQGRSCATGDCGIIHHVGTCYATDGAFLGQACYERAGNGDWVSVCNADKSKLGASTQRVLTTWLLP